MIYEFTFENYRSYRNETTISFVANQITEFEDTLIKGVDEDLLPVCSIYGPNGGGKSSVLLALFYMASLIIIPYIGMQGLQVKTTDSDEKIDLSEVALKWENFKKSREYYHWNAECEKLPSSFSILFQRGTTKYRYEITVTDEAVVHEALYIKRKGGDTEVVFERDGDDISVAEYIEVKKTASISKSLPFLVYLSVLMDIDEIEETVLFFLSVAYINFDNGQRDHKYPMKSILENKDRVIRLVQSMGIPICDLRAVYNENGTIKDVYTTHCLGDGKVSDEIDFQKESGGTRKIFSLVYDLISSIDNGSLVVVDELDAKLHPLLLRSIISLFTDPNVNKKGAQLLFTSHDITTMTNEVFRRDEIWFAAMGERDESVLYSLVDFKKVGGRRPRKDETYAKQYLEGRYGADPYLKKIFDWEISE